MDTRWESDEKTEETNSGRTDGHVYIEQGQMNVNGPARFPLWIFTGDLGLTEKAQLYRKVLNGYWNIKQLTQYRVLWLTLYK